MTMKAPVMGKEEDEYKVTKTAIKYFMVPFGLMVLFGAIGKRKTKRRKK